MRGGNEGWQDEGGGWKSVCVGRGEVIFQQEICDAITRGNTGGGQLPFNLILVH